MDRGRGDSATLGAFLTGWPFAAGLWQAVRDEAGTLVDLTLVDARDVFELWIGRSVADAVGHRYSELMPSGVHDRLPAYLRVLATGEPESLYLDRVRPDGGAESWEIRAVPLGGDHLLLANWDVTAARSRLAEVQDAHAQAQEAIDLLVATLNASPDRVTVLRIERDEAGRVDRFAVSFVNDAASAPTGLGWEEWIGADLRALTAAGEGADLHAHLLEVLASRAPDRGPLGSDPGATASVTRFGADHLLLEWTPVDQAADSAAPPPFGREFPPDPRTDPLTGLCLLPEFRRRLTQWLGENGGREPAAVLVADLDNFGRLNDLIGTHRADEVLALLGAELRRSDPWLLLPVRIADDKFGALVSGVLVDGSGSRVFARLQAALGRICARLSIPALTLSAGLCPVAVGDDADGLLRDADTAMRSAQNDGRNRLTVFTEEVRRALVAELIDAQDIRSSLAAGHFRLAFQPVVRIDSLDWSGEEALLRWVHPEHGLLPPDRFIPTAEATGAIVDLGAWVVDQAVARAAARPDAAYVGINVSPIQFLRSHVPAQITTALERTRVPADRLVVEITESTFMLESASVREQLDELHTLGLGIAVDDFGSGFSSIAYLDWIPVDVVKLDQLFLAGEMTPRRRALLRSTAALIRSIGATPLAEGIETADHLEVVREAGIELGQGYLFGRPQFAT